MATIAHGRPLIASRLGAFGELIQDGDSGFLVPPEDDGALAVAMERFILDAELRRTATAGMLRLRDSIPSWKEIAQRTVTSYQALADARQPAWQPTAAAGERASVA
jgi:glycosyltransferase involved in cell wall biosynthesis